MILSTLQLDSKLINEQNQTRGNAHNHKEANSYQTNENAYAPPKGANQRCISTRSVKPVTPPIPPPTTTSPLGFAQHDDMNPKVSLNE